MVKLRQLTVKGFRSFINETTIKFPSDGLLLLQGPNGSGKSTITLAIAYALGYCPFPASALKSWQGGEMQVTLELISPDGVIIIERGAKNSVTLSPWEAQAETVKGSVAAVEAKIRSLIGLDSDILGELCYRQQQTRGTFLSKTDKEKKEFLCGLLRLDKFETAVENAKAIVKKAELDYNYHVGYVSADRQHLDNFRPPPPRDLSILQKITDYDARVAALEGERFQIEERLVLLQRTGTVLVQEHHQMELKITAQVTEYTKTLTIDPYDDIQLKEYEKLCQKAQRKLNSLRQADSQKMITKLREDEERRTLLNRVRGEIASVERELTTTRPALVKDLEALLSNKCPTCEQDWNKAQDRVQQAEMMIATIDKRAESLPTTNAQLWELERAKVSPFTPDSEIVRYEELLKEATRKYFAEVNAQEKLLHTQNTTNIEKVNSYREGLDASLAEMDNKITANRENIGFCQNRLNQVLSELLTSNTLLSGWWNQVRAEDKALDEWKAEKARLEKSVEEKQAKADAFKTALDQEQDFLDLIGREGFLGAIFDEVLAEISNETNKVLAALPNTSDMFLEFRSENETGKGTVSREIKPVVTIRGHTAPLKAGCSGGMYLSVEQAVDIAINRVVSRRTGVVPGWIVLDECFGDQDLTTKEEAMSVLRELGRDRLVIVVDHATEFKEAFTQFINLKLDNGVSSVTV